MSRETREMGPYVTGEKPLLVLVDFYPSSPPNLTGWAVELVATRDGEELIGWGSVRWNNAAIARAELTMPEITLAPGKLAQLYRVEVWAGNGTYRTATYEIWFTAYRSIGRIPAI